MFDVGIAFAESIPIIGLAMASPQVGRTGVGSCGLVVEDFPQLKTALDRVMDTWNEYLENDRLSLIELTREEFPKIQKKFDREMRERDKRIIEEVNRKG